MSSSSIINHHCHHLDRQYHQCNYHDHPHHSEVYKDLQICGSEARVRRKDFLLWSPLIASRVEAKHQQVVDVADSVQGDNDGVIQRCHNGRLPVQVIVKCHHLLDVVDQHQPWLEDSLPRVVGVSL